MGVIPRDRVDWLNFFQQQMDELFRLLFDLEGKGGRNDRDHLPPIDIFETAADLLVEIELPGFDRDDLSLRMCCNILVVEGTKREEPREREVSYICLERKFGRFCRVVEIPPTVDLTDARARYERGLLTVAFKKLDDRKMIVREIPID